jgi:hypothetical protein
MVVAEGDRLSVRQFHPHLPTVGSEDKAAVSFSYFQCRSYREDDK